MLKRTILIIIVLIALTAALPLLLVVAYGLVIYGLSRA